MVSANDIKNLLTVAPAQAEAEHLDQVCNILLSVGDDLTSCSKIEVTRLFKLSQFLLRSKELQLELAVEEASRIPIASNITGTAELSKAKDERQLLDKELERVKAECVELKQNNVQLESRLKLTTETNDKLNDQIQYLLDASDLEMVTCRQALAERDAEINEKNGYICMLLDDVERLETERDQSRLSVDLLQTKMITVTQQLDACTEELEHVRADNQNKSDDKSVYELVNNELSLKASDLSARIVELERSNRIQQNRYAQLMQSMETRSVQFLNIIETKQREICDLKQGNVNRQLVGRTHTTSWTNVSELKNLKQDLKSITYEMNSLADLVTFHKCNAGTDSLVDDKMQNFIDKQINEKDSYITKLLTQQEAFETELDGKHRELLEVSLRLKQVCEREYGLSDAIIEIQHLNAQINRRNSALKKCYGQINILHNELNVALQNNNELRAKCGITSSCLEHVYTEHKFISCTDIFQSHGERIADDCLSSRLNNWLVRKGLSLERNAIRIGDNNEAQIINPNRQLRKVTFSVNNNKEKVLTDRIQSKNLQITDNFSKSTQTSRINNPKNVGDSGLVNISRSNEWCNILSSFDLLMDNKNVIMDEQLSDEDQHEIMDMVKSDLHICENDLPLVIRLVEKLFVSLNTMNKYLQISQPLIARMNDLRIECEASKKQLELYKNRIDSLTNSLSNALNNKFADSSISENVLEKFIHNSCAFSACNGDKLECDRRLSLLLNELERLNGRYKSVCRMSQFWKLKLNTTVVRMQLMCESWNRMLHDVNMQQQSVDLQKKWIDEKLVSHSISDVGISHVLTNDFWDTFTRLIYEQKQLNTFVKEFDLLCITMVGLRNDKAAENKTSEMKDLTICFDDNVSLSNRLKHFEDLCEHLKVELNQLRQKYSNYDVTIIEKLTTTNSAQNVEVVKEIRRLVTDLRSNYLTQPFSVSKFTIDLAVCSNCGHNLHNDSKLISNDVEIRLLRTQLALVSKQLDYYRENFTEAMPDSIILNSDEKTQYIPNLDNFNQELNEFRQDFDNFKLCGVVTSYNNETEWRDKIQDFWTRLLHDLDRLLLEITRIQKPLFNQHILKHFTHMFESCIEERHNLTNLMKSCREFLYRMSTFNQNSTRPTNINGHSEFFKYDPGLKNFENDEVSCEQTGDNNIFDYKQECLTLNALLNELNQRLLKCEYDKFRLLVLDKSPSNYDKSNDFINELGKSTEISTTSTKVQDESNLMILSNALESVLQLCSSYIDFEILADEIDAIRQTDSNTLHEFVPIFIKILFKLANYVHNSITKNSDDCHTFQRQNTGYSSLSTEIELLHGQLALKQRAIEQYRQKMSVLRANMCDLLHQHRCMLSRNIEQTQKYICTNTTNEVQTADKNNTMASAHQDIQVRKLVHYERTMLEQEQAIAALVKRIEHSRHTIIEQTELIAQLKESQQQCTKCTEINTESIQDTHLKALLSDTKISTRETCQISVFGAEKHDAKLTHFVDRELADGANMEENIFLHQLFSFCQNVDAKDIQLLNEFLVSNREQLLMLIDSKDIEQLNAELRALVSEKEIILKKMKSAEESASEARIHLGESESRVLLLHNQSLNKDRRHRKDMARLQRSLDEATKQLENIQASGKSARLDSSVHDEQGVRERWEDKKRLQTQVEKLRQSCSTYETKLRDMRTSLDSFRHTVVRLKREKQCVEAKCRVLKQNEMRRKQLTDDTQEKMEREGAEQNSVQANETIHALKQKILSLTAKLTQMRLSSTKYTSDIAKAEQLKNELKIATDANTALSAEIVSLKQKHSATRTTAEASECSETTLTLMTRLVEKLRAENLRLRHEMLQLKAPNQ